MEIKALIFDCDGTLADTMPLHWQAWQMITSRHGVVFPEARFYALGGVPSRHILQMLREEQRLAIDPIAVSREKEEEYLKLMAQIGPIHEVVEIAKDHAGKLPMAVASGGTKPVIEKVLRHLNIRALFAAVVTSEDVVHQKPSPDIFLEAARRLQVPPKQCRAYEDTDIGLTAIRAAAMDAVDVRTLLKLRQENSRNAVNNTGLKTP
ncbi:MAG TPA: HAD-IA family hydrolase [Candidatus Binatia bacterium]|nr:HAD-IA family hydrolase [Candidatus Binatia bacterium]